jgi:hypothetical protein
MKEKYFHSRATHFALEIEIDSSENFAADAANVPQYFLENAQGNSLL